MIPAQTRVRIAIWGVVVLCAVATAVATQRGRVAAENQARELRAKALSAARTTVGEPTKPVIVKDPVQRGLTRARALASHGETEQATRKLEDLARQFPGDTRALIELGVIALVERHDPWAALPYWERALARDPGQRAMIHQIGRVYRDHDVAAGIRFFDAWAAPENMLTLSDYYRGLLRLENGDAGGAIPFLERATNDANEGYLGWYALARARDDRVDGSGALAAYQTALTQLDAKIQAMQLADQSIEALVSLWGDMEFHAAESLLNHGLADQAYEVVIKLAARLPDDPKVTALLERVRDRLSG